MTKRSFYYPHDRASTWYTGEELDPVTGEVFTLPSMTKQEFKAECDINTIIKQFGQTGIVNHIRDARDQGQYADLPDEIDFQASLNLVRQAQESFASLPSKVRDRFGNDPAAFLEFMGNPDNQEEMISLGLATRIVQDAPSSPTPPVAPAPPAEPPKV